MHVCARRSTGGIRPRSFSSGSGSGGAHLQGVDDGGVHRGHVLQGKHFHQQGEVSGQQAAVQDLHAQAVWLQGRGGAGQVGGWQAEQLAIQGGKWQGRHRSRAASRRFRAAPHANASCRRDDEGSRQAARAVACHAWSCLNRAKAGTRTSRSGTCCRQRQCSCLRTAWGHPAEPLLLL